MVGEALPVPGRGNLTLEEGFFLYSFFLSFLAGIGGLVGIRGIVGTRCRFR